MRLHHRTCFLMLMLAAAAGAVAQAADTPTSEPKPGITPVHQLPPSTEVSPHDSAALKALPDSLAEDIQTGWRLRSRVGKAYWPDWAAHSPAPLVVRGNPFDYFILHPDPPERTSSPRVIPGGGYFHVSLERLPAAPERDTRIEQWNRWWCVSYDISGGRGGLRPALAALLASRDFMVYETMTWKPVWGSAGSANTVLGLRRNPDLIAWLDQEAVALRAAVLADDAKVRGEQARKAVKARRMAEEIAAKDERVKAALTWYEGATRSEGAARYMGVLLQDEARSVTLGDTSTALPNPGGDFAFRAKSWRSHLAKGKDRDVTGVNLMTLREVGAMYCVLLDASGPGWQAAFFDSANRMADLLDRAVAGGRNSKTFGG